jgi:hypothetical protein
MLGNNNIFGVPVLLDLLFNPIPYSLDFLYFGFGQFIKNILRELFDVVGYVASLYFLCFDYFLMG